MLLSPRDRLILLAAQSKLGGATDFAETLQALREAVAEAIPDGRIFLLGMRDGEPILGSVISGIGIVATRDGTQLVRIGRTPIALGRFGTVT